MFRVEVQVERFKGLGFGFSAFRIQGWRVKGLGFDGVQGFRV